MDSDTPDALIAKIQGLAEANTVIIDRLKATPDKIIIKSRLFRPVLTSTSQTPTSAFDPECFQLEPSIEEVNHGKTVRGTLSSFTASGGSSLKYHSDMSLFNDTFELKVTSIDDITRLNTQLPTVAKKFSWLDPKKAISLLRDYFLFNMEVLQVCLGQFESELEDAPPSPSYSALQEKIEKLKKITAEQYLLMNEIKAHVCEGTFFGPGSPWPKLALVPPIARKELRVCSVLTSTGEVRLQLEALQSSFSLDLMLPKAPTTAKTGRGFGSDKGFGSEKAAAPRSGFVDYPCLKVNKISSPIVSTSAPADYLFVPGSYELVVDLDKPDVRLLVGEHYFAWNLPSSFCGLDHASWTVSLGSSFGHSTMSPGRASGVLYIQPP